MSTDKSTEFHEGDCCIGCVHEIEADMGYYPSEGCCCYTGLTPLEQWDYVPKYPPVDGKVPEVLTRWKMASIDRWLTRFGKELDPDYVRRFRNAMVVRDLRNSKKDKEFARLEKINWTYPRI